jgi:hypothetical protein
MLRKGTAFRSCVHSSARCAVIKNLVVDSNGSGPDARSRRPEAKAYGYFCTAV